MVVEKAELVVDNRRTFSFNGFHSSNYQSTIFDPGFQTSGALIIVALPLASDSGGVLTYIPGDHRDQPNYTMATHTGQMRGRRRLSHK